MPRLISKIEINRNNEGIPTSVNSRMELPRVRTRIDTHPLYSTERVTVSCRASNSGIGINGTVWYVTVTVVAGCPSGPEETEDMVSATGVA